ncbi:DNA mismatch repair protein MLH3-like [Tasmannia lanceolata]|uniref:DNA mismatch repair protein MLH3-like n=1 Tax=Tasmannia lanceolata TaxID=3420 RepID=UPI00406295EC
MRSIKRLPRAVYSSLSSCIFLFDLTRVVEELVFNSVDAGASKVHVSVGVGACYVKVEDDGCGVSRDGLVLLGEKYATSKLHCLSEMDAGIESVGFRGEALGSLSDVSLLEVVTKARGRPNGHRKVIKACTCCLCGSI